MTSKGPFVTGLVPNIIPVDVVETLNRWGLMGGVFSY